MRADIKPLLTLLIGACLLTALGASPEQASSPAASSNSMDEAAVGHVTALAVDSRAILPKGAPSKRNFVRFYLLESARTDDDAPFTQDLGFRFRRRREVWFAIFIKTPSIFTRETAGVRVVSSVQDFPRHDHTGCTIINLIADAKTGRTLASWCNEIYDPEHLRMIPTYISKGFPVEVP